ncbi:MAG: hypothetical protein IT204_12705 [Fimbriimonadaceae bacterium]|nr:hypothetical protein [Fimbriimonadaceae bacterium]
MRTCWLLALLTLPAVAADLPRLALVGPLRMGPSGVLLRAGLPVDCLGAHEACDSAVLQRYDVVLAGSMWDRGEPWQDDAKQALASYLRRGGRVLAEAGGLPREVLPSGPRFRHHESGDQDDRPFRLAAGDHPLLRRFAPRQRFAGTGAWFSFQELDEVTVLATFLEGDAAGEPAIFEHRVGAGRLIVLASQLFYVQGNWRNDYDELLLALVDDLADGRARPQWDLARDVGDAPLWPSAPPPGRPAGSGWQELGDLACGAWTLDLGAQPRGALVVGDLPLRVAGRRLHGLPGGSLGLPNPAIVRGDDAGGELLGPDRVAARWSWPRPLRGRLWWRGTPARYTAREPLWVSDDFTRTGPPQQPGGIWQRHRGAVCLTGTGEPFVRVPEFALRLRDGEVATGEAGWCNYTLGLSVQLRDAREVTVAIAQDAAGRELTLRCPALRGGPRLVLRDGRGERELARGQEPLPPLQWTRLELGLTAGQVQARVGGEVLTGGPCDLLGGSLRIGCRGGEVIVDDVQIAAPPGAADPLPTVHPAQLDKGPESKLDRDTWAHPAAAWLPTTRRGEVWHAGRFNGPLTLSVPFTVRGPQDSLTVHRGPQRVARPWLRVGPGLPPGRHWLQVSHRGQPAAWLDGRPLPPPAAPAAGSALGLSWTPGAAPLIAGVEVASPHVQELTFERQPVDWWESGGTWQIGSRWPCQPQYAWLIGTAQPQAVLWHDRPWTADLAVQALLGVRMLGRYGDPETEPFERLRLLLAGNGRDPWSGYTLELGSPIAGFSRLYRKRQVVATSTRELPHWREVHNYWGDLRVELVDGQITAWLGRRPLLSWEDPEPLPPGQVGLACERNSLVTPYVAIYGEPGAPRSYPAATASELRTARRWAAARANHRPAPVLGALTRLLARLQDPA